MVLVVLSLVFVAAACNKQSASNTKNPATAGNEEGSAMDKSKDKAMMDDSHVLGVVNISGKIMTVWVGNETASLDHDLTLKNGTRVTKDGQITTASGTVITLKEGQELTTDGIVMTVDVSKMMMMKDETMTNKSDAMMASHGSYQDYSAATVASEQKAGHKVVLYFYAPWCPFCRVADADFKANGDKIPAGVTVFKTDYDSNTALKEKYGVNYQHTFVQIDASGNLVTKWVSGDTAMLVKQIK